MTAEEIIFQNQKEIVSKEVKERIKEVKRLITIHLEDLQSFISNDSLFLSGGFGTKKLSRCSEKYSALKDCYQEIQDCKSIDQLNKVVVPELTPSEY